MIGADAAVGAGSCGFNATGGDTDEELDGKVDGAFELLSDGKDSGNNGGNGNDIAGTPFKAISLPPSREATVAGNANDSDIGGVSVIVCALPYR